MTWSRPFKSFWYNLLSSSSKSSYACCDYVDGLHGYSPSAGLRRLQISVPTSLVILVRLYNLPHLEISTSVMSHLLQFTCGKGRTALARQPVTPTLPHFNPRQSLTKMTPNPVVIINQPCRPSAVRSEPDAPTAAYFILPLIIKPSFTSNFPSLLFCLI